MTRSLIGHDGYDPEIVVKKRRMKKNPRAIGPYVVPTTSELRMLWSTRSKKNPPLTISTTQTRKGLEVSAIIDNQLVRRWYQGYAKREAIALFKQDVLTKKNPPLMVIGNPKTYYVIVPDDETRGVPYRVVTYNQAILERYRGQMSQSFSTKKAAQHRADYLNKFHGKKNPLMVIGNPKIGLSKLKKGTVVEFHMTHLPGNPWFEYYVLDKTRNEIVFTSIPPSQLQYQAEHVSYTPLEFSRGLNDGSIRVPSHEGKMRINPSDDIMSDSVHEVRYTHRKDGEAYKHAFKPGVRMVANEDGTITMYHPTKRIHEEFPE